MNKEQSRNWRDQAINAAIHAEGFYGGGTEMLLREIRRRRPACATLAVWPDRLQLLEFFENQTRRWRSLLAGCHQHLEREVAYPYVGWYEVEWEQAIVEIALEPTYSIDGCAIIIAHDEEIARRFAAALEDYTIRPIGRCLRFSVRWESAPDIDHELGRISWDDLVLPEKLLSAIRESVEGFYHHREAFTSLGFPGVEGCS